MKQIRRHLTYANVMSSLSVFLILGGATAFAATKIGTKDLKAGAVKTGKLAKEAVAAGKIKNSAVTETKIADAAVTANKLADNAVTTNKIAADAVTTAKVANGAITSEKVGTGAITSDKIGNGAVGTGKLGNESVSEEKIASALRLRWARVRDTGALVTGRNVVSSESVGSGIYNVTFNSDVSNCGFVPARGTTGFEPTASFIGARALAGQPNTVRVLTFNDAGTAIGRDFTLLVVC